MHNYAPVLIGTLSRYEHFKRCVESLAECTHAEKTDLYIALDYPLNESHWDGYKEIANYVNEIKGFKSVVLIKRNKNFDVLRNYTEAEEEIFKKYDRIIVSEDDNEFSPNFLDYINKGLEKFKDNENVLAVCGYNIPMTFAKEENANYYYRRGLSGWGFGTWKKKWKRFEFSAAEVGDFIIKWENMKKTYSRNPKHLCQLLSFVEKQEPIYGDIAFGFYMLKNEKINSVYPTISMVRNHGHDGSGVHCNKIVNGKDIFTNAYIDKDYTFNYTVPLPTNQVLSVFKKYYSLSFKGKIKTFIRYVRFYIRYKK